jgi:hypothetical protein
MMLRLVFIALLALLWPALGQAQTSFQDRSGTITLGGTAQVLMPYNQARHGCKVQNISPGDLWINDQGTAALSQPSIKVPAGAQYTCDMMANGFTNSAVLSIIGATTGQAFAAREW